MAALTQKNGFENEQMQAVMARFKEYINSDLHSFNLAERTEYMRLLNKDMNKTNVNEFSKFPNNLIKQHCDGKINIV